MSDITASVERGINALKEFLGEDGCALLNEEKLRKGEVASFALPLPEDYLGVNRTLRIIFDNAFPSFGLGLEISPNPWLHWPHATKNSLCLYGVGQKPAIGSPERVVKETLDRLKDLIDLILPSSDSAKRESNFNSEITSYWDQQLHQANLQLILLNLPATACEIFVLSDVRQRPGNIDNYVWLSDEPMSLRNYLRRLSGSRERVASPAAAAFFVPLLSLPSIKIPDAKDILDWISSHVDEKDFARLVEWEKESNGYPLRWLLLSLPNTSPTLVRAFVLRGRGVKSDSYRPYGKRAGRRRSGSDHISPVETLQAAPLHLLDHSVIYSRDKVTASYGLATKKIIIVGAGTLGGTVATQLVRSGFGEIIIIDPDTLEDANIGRHVLGADDLGRYKVNALTERMSRDIPLAKLTPIANYIQFAVLKDPSLLDGVDAIVVTTADWLSEEFLWSLKSKGQKWALVQGWSEPHAIVGHVLMAPPNISCDGRFLFEENGNFIHRFSEWPNHGVISLPACGAGYIPGGSLSINNIANMISKSVIALFDNADVNLQPQWQSYVDNTKMIDGLGGTYIGPELPSGATSITLNNLWPSK